VQKFLHFSPALSSKKLCQDFRQPETWSLAAGLDFPNVLKNPADKSFINGLLQSVGTFVAINFNNFFLSLVV